MEVKRTSMGLRGKDIKFVLDNSQGKHRYTHTHTHTPLLKRSQTTQSPKVLSNFIQQQSSARITVHAG